MLGVWRRITFSNRLSFIRGEFCCSFFFKRFFSQFLGLFCSEYFSEWACSQSLHAELLFFSRGDEILLALLLQRLQWLLFRFRPLTAPVSLSVGASWRRQALPFLSCFSNSASVGFFSTGTSEQELAQLLGALLGSASVELLSTFTLGAISPSPPTCGFTGFVLRFSTHRTVSTVVCAASSA